MDFDAAAYLDAIRATLVAKCTKWHTKLKVYTKLWFLLLLLQMCEPLFHTSRTHRILSTEYRNIQS